MSYHETLHNMRGMAPDMARHVLMVAWIKLAKTRSSATLAEQEHALWYIDQGDLEAATQEVTAWSENANRMALMYAQIDAWRHSLRHAPPDDREDAPMLHATVMRSYADGVADSMTES